MEIVTIAALTTSRDMIIDLKAATIGTGSIAATEGTKEADSEVTEADSGIIAIADSSVADQEIEPGQIVEAQKDRMRPLESRGRGEQGEDQQIFGACFAAPENPLSKLDGPLSEGEDRDDYNGQEAKKDK